MSEKPWYHEGLRFQCHSGCGRCCTGEPGYVWVNPEEIRALAQLLRVDLAEFEAKYTRRVKGRWSLVEVYNGDCIFFENRTRRCKVYEARPRQCRTWPFWNSNLESPEAWRSVCRTCPGCGDGPLVSLPEIENQMALIRL
jgi:hypothetical protein